jgi:hypothetical protein
MYRRDQPLGWRMLECRTDAGGDGVRRLRLGVAHANDAEDYGLVAEAGEGCEIEMGLGRFDRDLVELRCRELGQKRLPFGLVARDIGIAGPAWQSSH